MNAVRILILCVTAALICASIRMQHPQIASAVALASGVVVLGLSMPDLQLLAQSISEMESHLPGTRGENLFLMRLCGIALVAEFASDICRDSGETSLARRIDTGTKLAMLAAAVPLASELMKSFSELLS